MRDAVALQEFGIFAADIIGGEWRLALADGVQHGDVALAMADRQREAVGAAAAGIDEREVVRPRCRGTFINAAFDTGVHDLAGDKALDVGAEHRAIFGGGASRITIVSAIDNPLSEGRIENPARALGDED